MNIKENVRYILERKGMTQAELGRKMGLTKQDVYAFLNREGITLTTMRKFAEALEVPVEMLVSETPLSVRYDIPTVTEITCPCCGEKISLIAKAK